MEPGAQRHQGSERAGLDEALQPFFGLPAAGWLKRPFGCNISAYLPSLA